MITILECGHALNKPERDTVTTGYGRTASGDRHCFACCAEQDRAEMIETGRHPCLYLTRGEVRNWPGSLRFAVTETRRNPRAGGFGSQRTDAWFRGPDGHMWHAINRGDNDIARCRRTAVKY